MPNAHAAAAAIGLPETTSADFHLRLGREIANACDELERLDAEVEAMDKTNSPGIGIVRQQLLHALDREEALIRALALHPARSLAGAAVQMAAAANLFTTITMEASPLPKEERAITRLLTSALAVVAAAAGVDVARDGIDHLADPRRNPWADPRQRIAKAFPEAVGVSGIGENSEAPPAV